jgi:hypothetical protein
MSSLKSRACTGAGSATVPSGATARAGVAPPGQDSRTRVGRRTASPDGATRRRRRSVAARGRRARIQVGWAATQIPTHDRAGSPSKADEARKPGRPS